MIILYVHFRKGKLLLSYAYSQFMYSLALFLCFFFLSLLSVCDYYHHTCGDHASRFFLPAQNLIPDIIQLLFFVGLICIISFLLAGLVALGRGKMEFFLHII